MRKIKDVWDWLTETRWRWIPALCAVVALAAYLKGKF
jgi:hypothetical protein